MESISEKPLSEIERDVQSLIRELGKQIHIYQSAGQTVSYIENAISLAQAHQYSSRIKRQNTKAELGPAHHGMAAAMATLI